MVIGILVCGILVYAVLDVVWTVVRRRWARTAEARAVRAAPMAAPAAPTPLEHVGAEVAPTDVESMLWTEADQAWLESRRISLPT